MKLLDRNGWKTSSHAPVPFEDLGDGAAVAIPNTFHAADLLPLQDRLELVAIDFPKLTDGRGYSTATLVRTRLQYRGDLRAIGEVLVDQVFMLRRVGFSSLALRGDQPIEVARAALKSYSNVYQNAADGSRPAFRRPAAVAA